MAVSEAEEAAIAFHAALTRIGVATLAEAITLWQRVSPTRVASTANAWLEDAIQMISSRRGQSRELAISYYRLVRALRTGSTLPGPNDPDPTYVTMEQLREEFAALVDETAPEAPSRNVVVERYRPDREGGDERVDVEADAEIERLEKALAEREREAEDEARRHLEALGPQNLEAILEDLDPDGLTGAETDALRDAAHRAAGARQASAAERLVLNGGRGELFARAEADKRALGFIRLSRTGTPCGWCAMLISRTVVYFSKSSAQFKEDGDKYHDNCHCFAEPVFSTEQYDDAEIFALNRQYAEEWPKVTGGLQGRAAISAWRKHIRKTQREARSLAESTAQEATE